jgi:DNA-binding NtrC family response regulator
MHETLPGTPLIVNNRNTVLVVDNDEELGRAIKAHLEKIGYQVDLAVASRTTVFFINQCQPKLVITDLQMPGIDGIELLCRSRDQRLQTTVVITTDLGYVESALETLKMGAYDYVTKPINYETLALVVHRAMERQTLLDEMQQLQTKLNGCQNSMFSLPESGVSLEEIERELLIKALQKFRGNQTRAARYLHISRRTLVYRMEKHNLRSARTRKTGMASEWAIPGSR